MVELAAAVAKGLPGAVVTQLAANAAPNEVEARRRVAALVTSTASLKRRARLSPAASERAGCGAARGAEVMLLPDFELLRPATIADAPLLAATIAAAFEQYRGKLVPESGAFRETADDDWLKKSDLAVTFLDRYGNPIGARLMDRFGQGRVLLPAAAVHVASGNSAFRRSTSNARISRLEGSAFFTPITNWT